MSTAIEHVTIGGKTDGRFVLSNSQIARMLANPNFVRIRIGFRIAFDDTGATLTGTPRFWIGLLASPQTDGNGLLSNGPANPATSHFVGAVSASSDWPRSTISYGWGMATPQFTAIKKVGTAITIGPSINGIQPYVSFAPALRRSAVLVDFKRGTPSFTISSGFPPDPVDQPYNLLEQAMAIPDFTAANRHFGATRVGSGSFAVDEAAHGTLNALCLYWDRQTPKAYVSEVLFSVFSL